MYIEPNGTIKIYKNVPLNNDYNNTLWFSNITAQQNYFSTSKYTLTKQSYQRVNKGSMRVQLKIENLYDCNYLAFQNAGFGTKWFYAFITSVEYVNNEASQINYEIDLMQTYLFDLDIKDSFVVREHSATDNIGDNRQPESFGGGDYKVVQQDLIDLNYDASASGNLKDNLTCIVTATEDVLEPIEPTPVALKGKIIDGLYRYVRGHATAEQISVILEAAKEKPDAILSIVMCPYIVYKALANDGIHTEEHDISLSTTPTGYTIKNKKCYTYPFTKCVVSNMNGEESEYAYENFTGTTPGFILASTVVPTPEIALYPHNYNNINIDFNSGVGSSEPVNCAWASDYFTEWEAQNRSILNGKKTIAGINAVTNALLGGIATGVTGNPMPVISNTTRGVSSVISTNIEIEAEIAKQKMLPNVAHGNSDLGTLVCAMERWKYRITQQMYYPDVMKSIDDYFTMYGYATNKVKIPNRSSRPHWNYVKTIGCNLVCKSTGGAPADDIKNIAKIYDKGITFWKYASEVGNYSLNNAPTS